MENFKVAFGKLTDYDFETYLSNPEAFNDEAQVIDDQINSPAWGKQG